MKRIISILVTVAMLVSLLAGMTFSTAAAETYSGTWGDLTWTLDGDTGELIISGEGEMRDFERDYDSPEAWKNYKDLIKSVIINEGVTNISDSAFYYCQSLTSITIPESVTSIGYCAFDSSGLKTIDIPDSVTIIEDEAFIASALASVTIGNGVTSMGGMAFAYCTALESVTIKNGVTSIGNEAFHGCYSLTSITIPNSVVNIGYSVFSGCSSLTSVTIPEGVESLGNYMFNGCSSLTSINIPNSVTSIGSGAFQDCRDLTSITIPNSVKSIGASAFQDCRALTTVTMHNSVETIDDSAFKYCIALTTVNYYGNEGDWAAISINENNNYYLLDATRNYIYHLCETFEKASVRISTEHAGLRFKTAIEQSTIDELIAIYGKENIEIGTIIVPEDLVSSLDAVTVKNLDAANVPYLTVEADIDNPFASEGGTNIYAGSVTDLAEINYARNFIGLGYIAVARADGEVVYYYSSTMATRSIDYVASAAINDISETQVDEYKYEVMVDGKLYYSPYTEAQREIILKFAKAKDTNAVKDPYKQDIF